MSAASPSPVESSPVESTEPSPASSPTLVRLIPDERVQEYWPISRQWRHQQARAGKFPKPVRIGARIFYREDELIAWINARPRGHVALSAAQSEALARGRAKGAARRRAKGARRRSRSR